MVLAYRTTPASSQSVGAVSSFVVNKQSGTTANDVILIYLFGSNSGAPTCPGFTFPASAIDADDIGCLGYRVATGTEATAFTVTTNGAEPVSGIIATVSGASSTITVGTANAAASATSLTVPGITMPGSGFALWFCGNENNYSGPGFVISPPAGFTSRATNGAQSTNATIMLADNQSASGGATGSKVGTAASSTVWAGVMVGLTPAATAATMSIPSGLMFQSRFPL